jgi:hypothetical protein
MQYKFLLAGAVIASALSAVPAFAEDLIFSLDNKTSGALTEFYASPVNVGNWEDDILGSDVLPAGQSVNITIADGREVCEYDLRSVFEDGQVVERKNLNLCETGSYTISE